MNYHYAIALCLALVVLMIVVDFALRRMLNQSKPLEGEDWNLLPTGRVVIGEIDNSPSLECDDYLNSKHREFHVRAMHLFSTHIDSPHYVALNFV